MGSDWRWNVIPSRCRSDVWPYSIGYCKRLRFHHFNPAVWSINQKSSFLVGCPHAPWSEPHLRIHLVNQPLYSQWLTNPIDQARFIPNSAGQYLSGINAIKPKKKKKKKVNPRLWQTRIHQPKNMANSKVANPEFIGSRIFRLGCFWDQSPVDSANLGSIYYQKARR